ncbi:major capsid protein [Burkholderia multivorans]|uniref:major capsid protein n=1 Tax=Burkholderia multivorans TaxID=87883 RepID=UPI000CFE848C|nr:major capsid protein [Burkholderia multivorans]MDN7965480.1 major capsid protein [Burkholderia multivorans]PRG49407.1 capsid protein [Burkholderia multivorans]HEM7839805.1 major capsid protein [Burkholderia multivorans]HEM7872886.1 major capsid protein [Burkholderia multivorans]HEM7905395.1 major capsid protein [Burkholderia multivorans]
MTTSFLYDTNTLIQVVPNLKLAQQFLLDKFFPNIVTADSEKVSIDVDVGKRRMAPFVSPLVEGKLVEQRRYQTNEFKPAYIKDKRAPDLRKPVRRMIGERIGGDLKGIEREMANLEAEMTDQIDILNRRLEWMAAQALLRGAVTIEGEGFETVVVDFGRDPELTVALTGAQQWTPPNVQAGTATPTADIETWQHIILKKSGAKVTDIVFSTSAWIGFLADPLAKGAIQYPVLAQSGNVINPGAQIEQGAVYKGKWGQYDLWVYNDWFVDDNNVEQPMLPDGDIIMSGPNLMGTRAFGQIMDPAFNYESLPFAPKTWVEQDPAQRILLMQSSPIVIPSRVNACFSANVCPAVVD